MGFMKHDTCTSSTSYDVMLLLTLKNSTYGSLHSCKWIQSITPIYRMNFSSSPRYNSSSSFISIFFSCPFLGCAHDHDDCDLCLDGHALDPCHDRTCARTSDHDRGLPWVCHLGYGCDAPPDCGYCVRGLDPLAYWHFAFLLVPPFSWLEFHECLSTLLESEQNPCAAFRRNDQPNGCRCRRWRGKPRRRRRPGASGLHPC